MAWYKWPPSPQWLSATKVSFLTHLPSMGWLHICIMLGLSGLLSRGEKITLNGSWSFLEMAHLMASVTVLTKANYTATSGISGAEKSKPFLRRNTTESYSQEEVLKRGIKYLHDNTSYYSYYKSLLSWQIIIIGKLFLAICLIAVKGR